MKHLLMCLIWLALSEPSCAKARTDYLPEDSIHVMTAEESDTLNTPAKKKSLITRFLDYFNDANKTRSIRNSTSASSAVHTTAPTPNWG